MIVNNKKIRKDIALLEKRISKSLEQEREISFKSDDKYVQQLKKVKAKILECSYEFDRYVSME